jgi:DNA-binding XRE family transcriptional regulator
MTTEWSGNIIRKKRAKLKLTQRKLADWVGCRTQTVSDWEADLYAPRDAYAVKLGEVFERLEKQGKK